MKSMWLVSYALVLWQLAACGDESSSSMGAMDASGGNGGSGAGETGGSGGEAAGAGGEGGNTALQAPVLDELEPVHGALHVYWTNVTPDCDLVHGERKTDAVAYAEVFSVPGNVNNKADQGASELGTSYTYRVRCEKGGVMSDYSNELSGVPQ